MKFKFNYKLTIALVSLFVGLLLIILGNKNSYCLSFGFIFFGLSLIMIANLRINSLKNTVKEIDEILEDDIKPDDYSRLCNTKIKLNKDINRIKIFFFSFAGLIILASIIMLFR